MLVGLILLFATPAASKACLHADVWDGKTESYDLTGCTFLNVTATRASPSALSLALTVTGSEIESLRLAHNDFDAAAAQALADALSDHMSLKKLHISFQNLGGEGAAAIARALRTNEVLTDLTITRCNIRNEGAAAVSELLRGNTVIQSLDVEMNDIATSGMAALGGALQENDVLRSLSIGLNPIFPAGAAQIAKALRRNSGLRTLNLRYSGIQDGGTVALASALQENRALRDLDLWYNVVGDAGAAAIGHMLKANGVLTRINLWDNNISDAGVLSIVKGITAGNAKLEAIHLGRNEEITDGSAVHFQRLMYDNEDLTFIDFGVGNTGVGSVFDEPLMKAGKCNRELHKLLDEVRQKPFDSDEKNEKARIILRDDAAKCRGEVLAAMPMRISVKDMLRQQGIDPVERRRKAEEEAKKLSEAIKELEKLPQEQQDEAWRIIREAREKHLNKTRDEQKAKAEAEPEAQQVNVNLQQSPHFERLHKLKAEAAEADDAAAKATGAERDTLAEKAATLAERVQSLEAAPKKAVEAADAQTKSAPTPRDAPKKHRATREQQMKRRRERAQYQAEKEEL